MKKLFYLFLLIFIPLVGIAQVSTGQEQQFDYGIQNLAAQTVTTPAFLCTQGIDGTIGNIPNSYIAKTATTININGVSQDLSANRTYRTAQADTGVLTFAGLTQNSGTTINIGAVTGYVVDNETNPAVPVSTFVNYAGATNVTVTTVGSGLSSYVMLSSAGVISFQNTFPTSAERKAKIWLGKVGHPSGTITTVGNEPDYITSPMAMTRDLFQSFGYINNGVTALANGANLNINTTAGTVTGDGINFVSSRTNPNTISISPTTVTSFLIRTQTGAGGASTTAITPGNYDVGGTVTAIPGGGNVSTLQYIWLVPGLGYIVTLGQTTYASLNNAIAAVGKETPVIYPNLINNAIAIGVLAVTKSATQLNNLAQAQFFLADKFGQFTGSTAGVSTATMQTAYNNSTVPQVTVTDALGAMTWQSGRSVNTSTISEWKNIAGTTTASMSGNGDLVVNSVSSSNVKITITTAVSITTATTDANGLGQNGRHVVIDNSTNAINITCNGGVTTTYGKVGTGAITFVQGSGRTLVQLSGTSVMNGAVGSIASIWSNGTTDYLSITNY